MMMTCKTITVDPLMTADEFLLALVAVKEQQANTDLAHAARASTRQKVTYDQGICRLDYQSVHHCCGT